MTREQSDAVNKLKAAMAKGASANTLDEMLWETVALFQGYTFFTVKQLEFTYRVNGGEMFVDRKKRSKSITKSSVLLAFHVALENDGAVTGPKKLGTFGASYLYPVFMKFGVIKEKGENTDE